VPAGPSGDAALSETHRVLGILSIPLVGIQLLVALFLRPLPGSKARPAWNFMHHNWGRITLLVALTNVFIGIVEFVRGWSRPEHQARDLAAWIAPCAGLLGVCVVIDVALTLYRQWRSQPPKQVEAPPAKLTDPGSNGHVALSPSAKPSAKQADLSGSSLATGAVHLSFNNKGDSSSAGPSPRQPRTPSGTSEAPTVAVNGSPGNSEEGVVASIMYHAAAPATPGSPGSSSIRRVERNWLSRW
jgi:hypothetical protein